MVRLSILSCRRHALAGAVLAVCLGSAAGASAQPEGQPEEEPHAPASSEGLSRLIEALETSDSFKVRATAAVALGRMQSSDGIEALSRAVTHDDSYAVRAAAAAALGRVGDPQAFPALFEALRDREPLVRNEANEAFARYFNPSYLLAFRDALRAEDPQRRLIAVRAYGESMRLPDASVGIAAQVVNALGDEDKAVAEAAALAMSTLAHERAVPLLVDGLENGGADVRAGCALLLSKRSDPRAVAPLIALVIDTDQSEAVRAAGRQALRAAAEYIDVDGQVAAAKDPASERHREALRVLAALGDSRALGYIDQGLKSSDPATRTVAARAAADLGSDQARAVLTAAVGREKDPRQKKQLELILRSFR